MFGIVYNSKGATIGKIAILIVIHLTEMMLPLE